MSANGGDDGDQLARSAARALRGDDGARLLAHLYSLTLARTLPPEADPAALRHLEGQRSLVWHLMRLIERGGGTLPDLATLHKDQRYG